MFPTRETRQEIESARQRIDEWERGQSEKLTRQLDKAREKLDRAERSVQEKLDRNS